MREALRAADEEEHMPFRPIRWEAEAMGKEQVAAMRKSGSSAAAVIAVDE